MFIYEVYLFVSSLKSPIGDHFHHYHYHYQRIGDVKLCSGFHPLGVVGVSGIFL